MAENKRIGENEVIKSKLANEISRLKMKKAVSWR